MMEYKGYIGHVEFDDNAEIFHGEVINTRDVITFQGKTVKEIKKAFRDSIEDLSRVLCQAWPTAGKTFHRKIFA